LNLVGRQNQTQVSQLNDDTSIADADLGVVHEKSSVSNDNALTLDDIDWAIEQGATTLDEIYTLVKDQKEQSEWQQ
jgi:hypothetical protein